MTVRAMRRGFGTDRYSGLYLAGIFILVFGITEPSLFLTASTVHSVASTYAVTAMLGVGALVPLAAGAYDLSIGSTVNFTAVLAALLQSNDHVNPIIAIVICILTGVVIGAVNGLLVVRFHINSFIATLGTGVVITAVQTIVTNSSQPLAPTSAAWNKLTQLQIGGFQIIFLYLIVIALFFWWVLDHTPPGRYLYAVGDNAETARLSGIRVDKWIWLSLVTSATVSGVAGIFYSSLSGPALTFGGDLLLPAFAAAFLGSTQFKPGRFNVWGTVLAVYVLAIGVKGLQLHTGAQWLNDMFNGVALIIAVGFAVWRQRRGGGSRREKNPSKEQSEPESGPAALDQAVQI